MKLPQLSLRELFLAVLVAGILCAWWRSELLLSEARLRAEQKQAEAEIELSRLKAEHAKEVARLHDKATWLMATHPSRSRRIGPNDTFRATE